MADSDFIEQAKIQSLFVRCMFYRDCHQWEKVRQTYHPDASKTLIQLSWIRGTIVDWLEGCKKIAAAPHTSSHHVIHPIEAIINGDRAVLYSTANMAVRATVDGVEVDMTSFVRFTNRAVRTAVPGTTNKKEWRLVSFSTTYVTDNIQVTGIHDSGNNDDGDRGGRGGSSEGNDDTSHKIVVKFQPGARESYKHLEWILSQRGIQVARDLPGTDIPESAEIVVKEAEAWLWASDKESA